MKCVLHLLYFLKQLTWHHFPLRVLMGCSNSLIQNLKPSNKQVAVNREKFYRGEILKLSKNVSKIAELQAM